MTNFMLTHSIQTNQTTFRRTSVKRTVLFFFLFIMLLQTGLAFGRVAVWDVAAEDVAGGVTPIGAGPVSAGPVDTLRDGSHDFDFGVGTWHTHIRRLQHPLSGSNDWVTLEGRVVTRKIWNGKANLEEIEADGPNGHFEGMNIFLYNPVAHQWSLTWATSDDGVLGTPTIGSFKSKNGRAEIFDQETFNGRTILVRGIWSDIKEKTHRFEQSFSDDGGKTWEPNFIAEKTLEDREPIILQAPITTTEASTTAPGPAAPTIRDGQHDYDFDFGTWDMHIRRLRHPLTDSATWYEMKGRTVNSKIWGGKGNIAEVEADGPYGHLELLALRLYNPNAHQWTTTFATSNVGVLSVPCIGEFRDGIGQFMDQEPFGDRTILVRFKIQSLGGNKASSEQAFSKDYGSTWETNWVNEYTKVGN